MSVSTATMSEESPFLFPILVRMKVMDARDIIYRYTAEEVYQGSPYANALGRKLLLRLKDKSLRGYRGDMLEMMVSPDEWRMLVAICRYGLRIDAISSAKQEAMFREILADLRSVELAVWIADAEHGVTV